MKGKTNLVKRDERFSQEKKIREGRSIQRSGGEEGKGGEKKVKCVYVSLLSR